MADPMQIGEIVSLDDTELSSGIVDGFIGSDGDEVDSFDEASGVVVHMIEGRLSRTGQTWNILLRQWLRPFLRVGVAA